jgi:selenophosphate synthase
MNHDKIKTNPGSIPPWSRIPSLQEMTEEAGIDFEVFIESIENNSTSKEMAEKFKVSESTITVLKEHFYKYGISSVMGGD